MVINLNWTGVWRVKCSQSSMAASNCQFCKDLDVVSRKVKTPSFSLSVVLNRIFFLNQKREPLNLLKCADNKGRFQPQKKVLESEPVVHFLKPLNVHFATSRCLPNLFSKFNFNFSKKKKLCLN